MFIEGAVDPDWPEYDEFQELAEESDNGLRTRLDRIRKDLILSLGKNRSEWTELQDLTRADANSYSDVLLALMSPNAVQRNLGVVKGKTFADGLSAGQSLYFQWHSRKVAVQRDLNNAPTLPVIIKVPQHQKT